MRSLAWLALAAMPLLAYPEAARGSALPPALPAKAVSPLPPEVAGARVVVVRAGADLQAAINAAQPDDTLVLDAGATWVGNYYLPARKNAGWITIRGSADGSLPASGQRVSPANATTMPKIFTPNSSPAISAGDGTHGWRLVGLEIGVVPTSTAVVYQLVSMGAGSGPWGRRTPADDIASRFAIEKCYIHGSPTQNVRRGVLSNAGDVRIVDSWIGEIHNAGFDSQAVLIYDSPGPQLIENNELQASTENIMLGGSDSSRAELVPSDIVIRRNHIMKLLQWKSDDPSYGGIPWVIKPLIELKSARRVLIEGNVLENSWVWPAFVADSFNQDGSAPWSVVEDVMFRHNRIIRAICPWQSWAGNVPVRRLAIINNVSDEAFDPGGGNAYTRGCVGLFLSSKALPIEDLWIEHNTVPKARGGIIIGVNAYLPRLTIRNNAFPYGPVIEGPWIWKNPGSGAPYGAVTPVAPDRDIKGNALFGAPAQAVRYDTEEFKVWASPEAAGVNPDGTLRDSSPLKRAATDGRDIGVDFAALRAADSVRTR